jgi:hypothetical protein
MLASDDVHATVCPGTRLPLASSGAAVNCTVSLKDAKVDVVGVTVTAVTRWATVTAAVPDTPPIAAVIVALPLATAVTRPVLLTVATAASDDVHVTLCPVTEFPLTSLAVAVS